MPILKEFIKKSTEIYALENPPDFITHLNYVSFLNTLSENLELSYIPNVKNHIRKPVVLDKKINLIKLTLEGLEIENKMILDNSEYAIVCVSWVSVKAYYLLYNMCLILKYLITGNELAFNSTHYGILKDFKGYISRGELIFNQEKFNKLYSCGEALKWKSRSGANIKIIAVDDEERFLQVIKKLALYSTQEFKRSQKLLSVRSKKNKDIYKNFLAKTQISICEFFYWYRIKANYRDLEYLNKDISEDKFLNFYCNYYDLMQHFYNAFKIVINKLSLVRLDEEILNIN